LFKKTTEVLDNIGKQVENVGNLVGGTVVKRFDKRLTDNLKRQKEASEQIRATQMESVKTLLDGEEIIDYVHGLGDAKFFAWDGKKYGILVLTPKRVLFYYLAGKKGYGSEDYPLDQISSINFTNHSYGSIVKIHSNNNVIEVTQIHKDDDVETFVKNTKQYIEKYKTPVAAVSNSNNNLDVADQIRKFAELRDQGILTEEEFAMQKRKLLGL